MLLTTNVEKIMCFCFFKKTNVLKCMPLDLFLWRSKCIIEAVVSVFGVRLSTGGVAHIIGRLCGSNLCNKKIFSEYFYLFIGETCYKEEKIMCLKYKYIPIFYYRFL